MSSETAMPGSAIEDESGGSIGDLINKVTGLLRRRFLSVAVCFLLCLPFGVLYYVTAPRAYTASTTMLIDVDKGPLPDASPSSMRDPAWVESQIGVLRSQNVAAYVVKQLRLADDPKFLQENTGPIDKLMVRLGWQDAVPKTEAERTAVATALVMGGLNVRRAGASYMLQIEMRAADPDHALKIANTIVDAYIFDQLNAKYQSNRRAGDWLQERLQALREQAAAAERAAIEFRAKNNIVKTGGTLMNEKQLGEMSGQLATSRSNAGELEARLNRITAVRRAYQEDQPPATEVDESVIEAMNNPIIGKLRGQYLDLINREADWSVKYGKTHQAVVNLRNQIRDIRKSIREELGRIEQTVKSELEISKKRQDEAEKAMTGLVSQSTATNQAQVTLFSLEAAAQSYRKLYDSFLQRHAETVQQQTLPMTDARMLSPAGITKASPQALQIALLTLLAGAMAGVGFGALRELMDRGFRTRDQVRALLGTECLALVPVMPKKAYRLLRNDKMTPPSLQRGALPWSVPAPFEGRRIRSEGKIWQHVVDAPGSPGAEAIRSLKMTLDLDGKTGGDNAIGITSCLPGEGKTTIAAAMAATIAGTGRRVILVDCDLRNPTLTRSLAPDARVGFFEVTEGRVSLSDAIWKDPTSNFDFLPAVVDAASGPRLDVLTSGAAGTFFDALRQHYDCVLVDLPPLVAGIDVRATVRHLTASVLIIEWGVTKIDQVEYALRHAKEFKNSIAGVVLNKVDMTAMGLYDSYGSQYYYGRPRHTVN